MVVYCYCHCYVCLSFALSLSLRLDILFYLFAIEHIVQTDYAMLCMHRISFKMLLSCVQNIRHLSGLCIFSLIMFINLKCYTHLFIQHTIKARPSSTRRPRDWDWKRHRDGKWDIGCEKRDWERVNRSHRLMQYLSLFSPCSAHDVQYKSSFLFESDA